MRLRTVLIIVHLLCSLFSFLCNLFNPLKNKKSPENNNKTINNVDGDSGKNIHRQEGDASLQKIYFKGILGTEVGFVYGHHIVVQKINYAAHNAYQKSGGNVQQD